MTNSDRRQCLRGLEDRIFDHVCLNATALQWAEWLQLPLLHVAAAGDRNVTLKLLAAGARGNAMMEAARSGHEELVDDLLQAGVHPAERGEVTCDLPIHVASALGHSGIVRSLLRKMAEKDKPNSDGQTSLHLAAERGHLPTVQALLTAGAGVEVRCVCSGRTALALACRGGHLGTVATLLQHGADVAVVSSSWEYRATALHDAALNNHPECITALVDAGADIEARGGWYTLDRTPLHCAAESGCTEAVAALLRHGALKDARDASSLYTPLYLAIEGEHVRVIEALLSAGADVSLSDSLGTGFVDLAARGGNVEILKTIIQYGGNVHAVKAHIRRTPLYTAACSKQVGAIHVLVEAGADVDVPDARGESPLHGAASLGWDEGVVALLGYGADKDKKDNEGRTPLYVAAERGWKTTVEALLTAGADATPRLGGHGWSALACAAAEGFVAVVELLVRHGADVNAATSTGLTALHRAAWKRGVDSIGTLVRLGAFVDVQDEEGDTPLMTAVSKGACSAALSLLKHGANVNAQDHHQESALHKAACLSRLKDCGLIVALLLEWDADETATNALGLTPAEVLEIVPEFDDTDDSDSDSFDSTWSSTSMYRIRGLLERAPAERRTRAWRRRRLLIMWRVYPNRFKLVEKVIEAITSRVEHKSTRSRTLERIEGNGVGGGGGSDSGAVGVLAERVAGLEEDGVFREIVMFL